MFPGSTKPLPSNRITVEEGKTKVLHCLLDSSAPTSNLHYSWTKDGRDVMSPPQPRLSIIVDGSLYIKNTKRSDSGVYRCTAKGLDPTGTKILSYPGTDLFLDIQCKLKTTGYFSTANSTFVTLPKTIICLCF